MLILSAYFAILAAIGVMAAALGPALPSLALNVHSSLQQASLFLAARPAGYIVGNLLAGRSLDRLPGHPLLVAALCLAAGMFSLLPQMQSLGGLTLVILGFGMADGILDVGTNTLLPWIYGKRSGPYLNALQFFFGVGALAAPLLMGYSMSHGSGVASAFRIMGLSMLPVAALLLFLKSPARPAAPSGPKGAPGGAPLGLAALVLLVLFFYGGAESGCYNWIYSYALKSGMAGESQSAYLTSLFWMGLTVGRLVAIPIAFKVPLGRVLAFDAAGALLSAGAMLLFPASHAALWLGCAGCGLFLASFFPTMLAYAALRLSPSGSVSGALSSAFFIGSGAGSIVIPWIIGQGFEAWGVRMAPLSIFLDLVILSLLLWRLLDSGKSKGLSIDN